MADAFATITGTIGSGFSSLAGYAWIFWTILILAMIGGIVFLIAKFFRSKEKWNLTLRVYQENNEHKTIYLDPVIVKGRRVTLSNGLRLIYLNKEILGKRLFPLLNFYTRPGVYDILITSDNRIFIITGIKSIDEQRKELKVGIRYPGIDYSLEEVNRDHAKLNQLDRRSDLLGMVKAAASVVLAIIVMVVFILGAKYYLDAKEIDARISQAELDLFKTIQEDKLKQQEYTNAMILLTDKMKDMLDSNNLRNNLNEIGVG